MIQSQHHKSSWQLFLSCKNFLPEVFSAMALIFCSEISFIAHNDEEKSFNLIWFLEVHRKIKFARQFFTPFTKYFMR